jgi:hypothetical protein
VNNTLYSHHSPFSRDLGLIDPTTPKSAYTRTSLVDGATYDLVFSDEFDVDGRSFYPGDDPYWEALDLHYWYVLRLRFSWLQFFSLSLTRARLLRSTNNLEWYDPSQVTTEGGSLKITLAAHVEHGLNYTGGMVSSWNKFCFTGGYIEGAFTLFSSLAGRELRGGRAGAESRTGLSALSSDGLVLLSFWRGSTSNLATRSSNFATHPSNLGTYSRLPVLS